MLSNRTIKFLAVAALIAVAAFATASMVSLPNSVAGQPMAVSNAQGLAQYYQSERAGYTTEMGLAKYHRSEWGLNAPQADGLAIYFDSERSIPIRLSDPFAALIHSGPGR